MKTLFINFLAFTLYSAVFWKMSSLRWGARGAVPPNGCYCPPILVYSKYWFWNITQQDNGQCPLIFFRFFAKLLATNCSATQIWRNIPSYQHGFTDVSRKRHESLQNRYQCFVSDYDMKQCVKTFFFKGQQFWFLQLVVQQGWRGIVHLAKSFRKFNLKIRAFKRILHLA